MQISQEKDISLRRSVVRVVGGLRQVPFFMKKGMLFIPVFFALITLPALAATPQGGPVIANTAQAQGALCDVFNLLFNILIFVSVIMVMWAGYLYATGKDDAEQITEAKKAMLYAAIGIIVAIAAKGFPLLVASIFPGASSGVQGC
jgi:cytochrome bd-type quinol oxidase subunit 2